MERLRLRGGSSGHHAAGPLVAHGKRLTDSGGEGTKRPVDEWRRDHAVIGRTLDTAEATSAPASSRPRSDGLIGAASTRTSTSPGARDRKGTSANESSSVPCSVTSERSSSERVGSGSVTVDPSSLYSPSARCVDRFFEPFRRCDHPHIVDRLAVSAGRTLITTHDGRGRRIRIALAGSLPFTVSSLRQAGRRNS